MKVVVRLEPCYVCQRDRAFGAVHYGCFRCVRVEEERDRQPRLVRVSESPLVYAEPTEGKA